ncbi:UNKNOWN [Stylonychia lemnae]|uniref:Uncharacterized protein n=1 Tax=Stylonychia lemnae TaxID=5949 RepID=A0A077ZZ32_STYLE|nr:UNKNOWN [Stylonychia lemnae]|eukprot:CDW74827.1 UNKNOWN [Stylonychia lemnae]
MSVDSQVIEDIVNKTKVPYIASMLDCNLFKYFPKLQLLKDEVMSINKTIQNITIQLVEQVEQKDVDGSDKNIAGDASARELGIIVLQIQREVRELKMNQTQQQQSINQNLALIKELAQRQPQNTNTILTQIITNEPTTSITQNNTEFNTLQIPRSPTKTSASLTKQNSASTQKLNFDVDFKVSQLLQEVSDIHQKLEMVATQEQVQVTQNKFLEYCTLTDLQRVVGHFDNFAKRNEFTKLQDKNKQFKSQIKMHFKQQEEFSDTLQFIREDFAKKLDTKLSLDAHNKKIDEDIKTRIQAQFQTLSQEVKQRTTQEETSRLWKNFQTYAEYNDLKELYNKVVPEVQKFEESLLDLNRECRKTQEIVRRFDEVILDKASKQNIRELYKKLDDYVERDLFIDYKADNNVKFQNFNNKQAKLEESLDYLGKNINKDIIQVVKKEMTQQGIKLQTGLQNPNPINLTEGELKGYLESKADKVDVIEIRNTKSNKQDTENSIKWIELLHKYIKNVSVLQTEIAKQMQSSSTETEQQRISKVEFLIGQCQRINNWIFKFDLNNIDEYFQTNPNISSKQEIQLHQSFMENAQDFQAIEKFQTSRFDQQRFSTITGRTKNSEISKKIRPSTISPLNLRIYSRNLNQTMTNFATSQNQTKFDSTRRSKNAINNTTDNIKPDSELQTLRNSYASIIKVSLTKAGGNTNKIVNPIMRHQTNDLLTDQQLQNRLLLNNSQLSQYNNQSQISGKSPRIQFKGKNNLPNFKDQIIQKGGHVILIKGENNDSFGARDITTRQLDTQDSAIDRSQFTNMSLPGIYQ